MGHDGQTLRERANPEIYLAPSLNAEDIDKSGMYFPAFPG